MKIAAAALVAILICGHGAAQDVATFNWALKETTDNQNGANEYMRMSSDGSVFAMGSFAGGSVEVHELSGDTVTLRETLLGDGDNSSFGWGLALSADGSVLAAGDYAYESNTGRVSVYQWDGSTYEQIGQDLVGTAPNDSFGVRQGMSLSADGTIVAAGASGSFVKVYQYSVDSWTMMGQVLFPQDVPALAPGAYSNFGQATDLSSDGLILAVGCAGWNNNRGAVVVYAYDQVTNSWEIRQTFLGESAPDHVGHYAGLSSDGNVLALSSRMATNPDAAGEWHGYIKVFQWDASAGQYSQRGSTIWGPTNEYLAGYRSTRLSSDGTVLLTANDVMPGNKVEVFKFNGSNYVPYGDPITSSQYISTADISGDGSKVMLIYWQSPTANLYAAPPPPTTSPTPSPTAGPSNSPSQSPTHSPSSSPTYTPKLAKYIKIQHTSSGALTVSEVQIINESSIDVATAAVVTMSSTDGGNVPANAVDGDTNTAATTLDESTSWIQIELAQETDISKVIINSDNDLSSARVSLLDEEGKTVFAAEGSVLAAATNGSGALEINGPDFQNAETSSPSSSPTMNPTSDVVAAGSENSLYYPDWTKSNGGCKTGGGQPLYMTRAPSTWMKVSLDECCEWYFGWMLDECKGTSGAAPSGLWYPDWAGPDDTCKNDGSEPQYMALNPVAWMHSSKQACCDANFGWMLNECLGSSGPDAGATNKWFIDWDDYKCKRNCAVGTGPSCGGRAESWDELFDTRSACCSTKAAWNPTCLVD